MKTNVEYVQKDYFVNESKDTVVCNLLFQIDLDKIRSLVSLVNDQRIKDFINQFDPVVCFKHQNIGSLFFEVTGRADKNPTDNFDEDLGKKIALTRAQSQAFEIANLFYRDLNRKFMEVISDINYLVQGSHTSIVNCNTHVRELCK